MTEQKLKLDIIGFDCGWGCKDYGCEDGPRQVDAARILNKLRTQDIAAHWRGPLGLKNLGNHKNLDSKEKTLSIVTECLRRLANHTHHAAANGIMPVVLGGDHSSGIGTWSGVISALKCAQNFGLIWIDAHMDSHTYETSHQGKFGGWWHGQPVAALLGHGLTQFREIGGAQAKISPQHLSLIGIHSFEPAESEFVKKHNIRVFYFEEVMQRGFAACFAEAVERATRGTAGFGISLDLDVFRPEDAPGVGAQESKGLIAADVLPIIKSIGHHTQLKGFEIAEFNPHRDINNKTRILLEKVVESVFTNP